MLCHYHARIAEVDNRHGLSRHTLKYMAADGCCKGSHVRVGCKMRLATPIRTLASPFPVIFASILVAHAGLSSIAPTLCVAFSHHFDDGPDIFRLSLISDTNITVKDEATILSK